MLFKKISRAAKTSAKKENVLNESGDSDSGER